MDWARAKTILISIFLILNIFLLTTIIFTNTTIGFQSDYKRYAKEYLSSRDIKVNARIPDIGGKIGKLTYMDKSVDLNKLTRYVFGHARLDSPNTDKAFVYEEGDEAIELAENQLLIKNKPGDGPELFQSEDEFQKEAYSFLENMGYSKKSMMLQSSESTDKERILSFNLKYKNAVLFDQVIKLKIDNNGLMTVSLPLREVKRINNSSTEILSAYQVLVMGGIPEGVDIESVDFGYKQIGEGDIYETPVWRVILGSGEVLLYNAYTGETL